jgi:hypothetical protein
MMLGAILLAPAILFGLLGLGLALDDPCSGVRAASRSWTRKKWGGSWL